MFLQFACACEKGNYDNSSLSKEAQTNNFYLGKITVIGNEPFTNLGLNVNDTATFILECNDEIKNHLLKNQGQTYKIYTNKRIETSLGTKLSVIKIEKVIK